MAVSKIKVVSIIGRMKDLGQVTAVCGKSGIFHPDNALSFYSDTSQFTPLTEENPYADPLQQLTDAVSSVRKKLTLLPEKKVASAAQMEDKQLFAYTKRVSGAFAQLQAERQKAQQQIQKYTQDLSQFEHFTGLDLDLDEIRACEYIKVRFGRLPKESYDKMNLYTENPYVIFFPSSNDEHYYWGVYFAPIEVVSEVDRIFSGLYFERVWLTTFTGSPESACDDIRRQREKVIEEIKSIDSRIAELWEKERAQCQYAYTVLTEKSVCFGIRRYAARYHGNFILTGWIPAECEKSFSTSLDAIDSVEYSFADAKDELAHSPPIRLKNRFLFRPFEFFVDMYGLPAYDEVDPTPFVAFTYILLFGIMFGDLGQGLVVSLVGWIMWKWRKMPLGKILVPCGISSAIFGTIFGSVFGLEHVLDPFYQTVFHLEEKPIEVMDADTTNLIIYAAIGIGLVLVVLAILINIYSSLRRRHYENALFGPNGVAGLVFYCSIVVGFGGQIVFGWQIVNTAYVLCLIVLPLAVIFFREILGALVEGRREDLPKKWGDFLMQNFFEVFEFLLSYATNTMSFLRVGAFVLVHAGMMLVVFTLAEMLPGIGYLIVAVIGNIFIMCLEGLLVGIQVLRLEFYEMFSRFFDGTGRAFHPVTVRREE